MLFQRGQHPASIATLHLCVILYPSKSRVIKPVQAYPARLVPVKVTWLVVHEGSEELALAGIPRFFRLPAHTDVSSYG